MNDLIFSVSDFVAIFNHTLEFAYPSVTIVGELANFRLRKNQWLYFDLKDENASVNFFGSKFQLPGPVEEGLLLKVRGQPRLHPLYGFSVNVETINVSGEGSIKRAQALLEAKLTKEGIFDQARKRALAYPPERIGLVTSSESAAYGDFTKVLNQRWGGVGIELADVQVQGEAAVGQIVEAIELFNSQATPPEVLVITRGGGSADDLAVFNTEQVVRAIATSRIPTLVAVGHEMDVSLGEKAADRRASTPSNAAELLVPDRRFVAKELVDLQRQINLAISRRLQIETSLLVDTQNWLTTQINRQTSTALNYLESVAKLFKALSPAVILKRGYGVIRDSLTGKPVKSVESFRLNQSVDLQLFDGTAGALIKRLK